MGNDSAAGAGELGDDLALRDARVGVAEGCSYGAMEWGVGHDAEGRHQLVDATAQASDGSLQGFGNGSVC